MLTECDIRGAAWPRTVDLLSANWLQAQSEVNAAEPRLWTTLQKWVTDREEELPMATYRNLPKAAANAWVEWLEELQGTVREAHVAEGVKQAVTVIVSCCSYLSNLRESWLTCFAP